MLAEAGEEVSGAEVGLTMRTSWILLLVALALVLGKGVGAAQEVDRYISAFEDTQLELVKYPLDYPNRAIGRLLLKDIGNLDSSVCNPFLIGK